MRHTHSHTDLQIDRQLNTYFILVFSADLFALQLSYLILTTVFSIYKKNVGFLQRRGVDRVC